MSRRIDWSPELLSQIRQHIAEGGLKLAAERTGINYTTLYNRQQRSGFDYTPPDPTVSWDPARWEEFKSYYRRKGLRPTAKHFQISRDLTHQKAVEFGLAIKLGAHRKISTTQLPLFLDHYRTHGPLLTSQHFDLPFSTCRRWAEKHGIRESKRKNYGDLHPEFRAYVTAHYGTRRAQDVAADLQLPVYLVVAEAHRQNLPPYRGPQVRKPKDFNEHYFEGESLEVYYDLGFGFADGSLISRQPGYTISLKRSDESYLYALQSRIGSKYKISQRDVSLNGKLYPASKLSIYSQTLYDSLKARGMVPRKSYLDPPYPSIPDAFFSHFARGYFDGDGSIWRRSNDHAVQVIGSPTFMYGYYHQLLRLSGVSDLGLKDRLSKKGRLLKVCEWSTPDDMRKLYDFFYPAAESPRLERKYHRFCRYLKL